MLTITTDKHTLYINTDLLKSRIKNAFITLLKISTYILIIAGILFIIGTAGSNTITLSQIITQFLQGFLCCGVAWVLNFIKLVIE